MTLVLLAIFTLTLAQIAPRNPKQVTAFRNLNPCPATGLAAGACPGWVVDHIIPLSVYGPDTPENMQWQTVEDAKKKDRLEYRAYRARVKAEKRLCQPRMPPEPE